MKRSPKNFIACVVLVGHLSTPSAGDASSTSHVSISLGKSSVKYNNDHVPGSPYGPKHHFSLTPFYHTSPVPPYLKEHEGRSYPSTPARSYLKEHVSPGYHSTVSPIYGNTVGPFVHSTPSPVLYGRTPKPQYYTSSTPHHERVHAVHIPNNVEDEKQYPMPSEIEKHVNDLKKEEMETKVESKDEKSTDDESQEEEEKEKDADKEREKPSYLSTSKPKVFHPSTTSYTPRPQYHPSEEPLYIPKRHYSPHQVRPVHKSPYAVPHSYSGAPVLKPDSPHHDTFEYNPDEAPKCVEDDKFYCDKDEHYPEYEITNAVQQHADKLLLLYADVSDINTELSVDLPKKAAGEESYICPSDITYAQLFRAKNTDGKWRIIVNNIKLNYQKLVQTVRLEECLTAGETCSLVPHCYESKCLQKSVYHRFLVYDPYDRYFPFAIESFKLPASCACHLGEYKISH